MILGMRASTYTFLHVLISLIGIGSGFVVECVIIATGNTSALRGKAGFVGFAPTRAAQRIPAESIAGEVVPKGVAVAQQDRSAWSFNVELRPFRETR